MIYNISLTYINMHVYNIHYITYIGIHTHINGETGTKRNILFFLIPVCYSKVHYYVYIKFFVVYIICLNIFIQYLSNT